MENIVIETRISAPKRKSKKGSDFTHLKYNGIATIETRKLDRTKDCPKLESPS